MNLVCKVIILVKTENFSDNLERVLAREGNQLEEQEVNHFIHIQKKINNLKADITVFNYKNGQHLIRRQLLEGLSHLI